MYKFEDFAKLEIRIGTIIEAERVKGTDKLLRIVVDMGNEKRQVIGGFGHILSPEYLIGKQAPIVVNIEKAIIRGVESNGIFMAIDSDKPVLLLPDEEVPNGSKVR